MFGLIRNEHISNINLSTRNHHWYIQCLHRIVDYMCYSSTKIQHKPEPVTNEQYFLFSTFFCFLRHMRPYYLPIRKTPTRMKATKLIQIGRKCKCKQIASLSLSNGMGTEMVTDSGFIHFNLKSVKVFFFLEKLFNRNCFVNKLMKIKSERVNWLQNVKCQATIQTLF